MEGRFSRHGPKLLPLSHLHVCGTAYVLSLGRRYRAKCSALVPPIMQFAQQASLRKRARAFYIHNPLNSNMSEERDPAAQLKLNRSTWTALIRLLSYVYIKTDLPDDR